MFRDILAMAVVGVVVTIAVPFVFVTACLWQLWEISCDGRRSAWSH